MISSFIMSREKIANLKFNDPLNENQDLDKSKKVNINVLLNNIRTDKKRELLESSVFIGLIAVAVIITGFISSL